MMGDVQSGTLKGLEGLWSLNASSHSRHVSQRLVHCDGSDGTHNSARIEESNHQLGIGICSQLLITCTGFPQKIKVQFVKEHIIGILVLLFLSEVQS